MLLEGLACLFERVENPANHLWLDPDAVVTDCDR